LSAEVSRTIAEPLLSSLAHLYIFLSLSLLEKIELRVGTAYRGYSPSVSTIFIFG
jgi:hypothetical protein